MLFVFSLFQMQGIVKIISASMLFLVSIVIEGCNKRALQKGYVMRVADIKKYRVKLSSYENSPISNHVKMDSYFYFTLFPLQEQRKCNMALQIT